MREFLGSLGGLNADYFDKRNRMWGAPKRKRGNSGGYVGPLDLALAPLYAYSSRALSALWLGQPLYTLRRDSDDATQSFNADAVTGEAPVTAIIAWLNGATGFIELWNDQSGNGLDALNLGGDDEALAQWTASAQGGKPAIGPADGQLHSTVTIANAPGTMTFFLVGKAHAFLSGNGGPGANDDIDLRGGSSALMAMNTNSGNDHIGADYSGQLSNDISYVLDGHMQFGARSFRANGVELTPTVVLDTGPTSGIDNFFASLSPNADPSNIQEGIVYASVKSDADCLAIRQNMAAYYGITLA